MTLRLSFALVLPLLVAGAAAAQEPDTATTVPDSVGPPVRLPPLVVTGTKVPVRRDQVGFAMSVLSAEHLAAERPLYAADALRELPGAFIDEASGPGGPTIVRLRGGEEVFTQIVMDGVQINQNGGVFDFQGLTLTNVERIEVARGPQSAVYGSSAVSGVVQFVTQAGEVGRPRFDLQTEGGGALDEGGTFRSSLAVRGGAGAVRYSAGVGATYSRGIYDLPHDTWTRDASARVDVAPAPRWDLTGLFRFIGLESNLPVRDPGARRVPLDPNARNERDRVISSVTAAFRPTATWTHRLRASLYREDFVFEDRRDDVPTDSFDFFIFDADFTLDSDLRRPTVEYIGSYTTPPGTWGGGLTLTFGGQWERETLSDRTGGEFGDGSLMLGRSSGAGFLEVQAAVTERIDVLVGTRVERFEGFGAEFTPRANGVVRVVPELLAVRAAAGRAYKAPNLQEQFLENPFIESNPDLQPETSTSWEVGFDLEPRAAPFTVGVTYFRQDYDNLIRTVAQDDSPKQINRNLGSSRAQGLEWSVRYRPFRWWRAGVDGAWIETEILDNAGLSEREFPKGEALPFRPRVVASAFVELTPVERLQLFLRGTVVGTQTVLTERFSGERVKLKPYFLPSVNVNLALSSRVSLYTRIDNLFDAYYKTAFDRPGIPLTAAAGVRLGT